MKYFPATKLFWMNFNTAPYTQNVYSTIQAHECPWDQKNVSLNHIKNRLLTYHQLSHFCIINFRKSVVIELEEMKVMRIQENISIQRLTLIEINLDVLCIHNINTKGFLTFMSHT